MFLSQAAKIRLIQEIWAMIIGIPRQSDPAETRAAMSPAVVKKLASEKVQFAIEAGAGVGSGTSDD